MEKAPTKPLLFVLLSCLLLLSLSLTHGCFSGKGCLYAEATSHDIIRNRKVLYVLGGKRVVLNMNGLKRENGPNVDKWEELRRVPAGPDPLHHHGSGPKKPINFP